MLKVYCDRCGEECSESNNSFETELHFTDKNPENETCINLCDYCRINFLSFMEEYGRKVGEN